MFQYQEQSFTSDAFLPKILIWINKTIRTWYTGEQAKEYQTKQKMGHCKNKWLNVFQSVCDKMGIVLGWKKLKGYKNHGGLGVPALQNILLYDKQKCIINLKNTSKKSNPSWAALEEI